MKDTITIYWSSSLRDPSPPDQWYLKEPEPVKNYFVKNIPEDKNNSDMGFFGCPAAGAFLKNLFTFKANKNDKAVWPAGYLKSVANQYVGPLMNYGNNVTLRQSRKSAIDGYIDLIYDINYVMFADKPLTIRWSTPNYPPSAPSPGAMLISGEFDIGRWYRPAVLNWFVPVDNTEFEVKEGDDLFYFQALTDSKIVFQKFMMTDQIRELAQSFLRSIKRDGTGLTLEERYQIAEGRQSQESILAEIKKNLITTPYDHNT
jgi:hypothetical protein